MLLQWINLVKDSVMRFVSKHFIAFINDIFSRGLLDKRMIICRLQKKNIHSDIQWYICTSLKHGPLYGIIK